MIEQYKFRHYSFREHDKLNKVFNIYYSNVQLFHLRRLTFAINLNTIELLNIHIKFFQSRKF